MSFIGHDMKPAPKLKEARLTSQQMNTAYQQCIQVSKESHQGHIQTKLITDIVEPSDGSPLNVKVQIVD